MTRQPVNSDFAGKTVDRVDTSEVDKITFYFTDGTLIALGTEHFRLGIACIVVCEEQPYPDPE